MDDIVIRSMLKWPDIPDVYGWLRLDRRGNWQLRGESTGLEPAEFGTIGNAAFREFIARNYAADERGCWFFQNGPQRVFVGLAYSPFVFHIAHGGIIDHCGRSAESIEGAWLDEEGSLVLSGSGRIGLLDDRDLVGLAEQVTEGVVRIGSASVPVGRLAANEIEARFGFARDPKP
jgi:hypothetical protein